jgi:hypothetical protein
MDRRVHRPARAGKDAGDGHGTTLLILDVAAERRVVLADAERAAAAPNGIDEASGVSGMAPEERRTFA